MEYSDVIKQLENITVDESKYNRKDYYRKFITVRNHYLAAIHPLPPVEETKLLFEMLDCLEKWIFIHNKNGEKRYSGFLSNILLARKNTLMTAVPKILHFVCLCEMTHIQRDYINLWIAANPDYVIKIHTDKYAFLARELAVRLQKQASKETLNHSGKAFRTALFSWQNDAFNYIRNRVATEAGIESFANSFDNCVKAFCQERGLGTAEELDNSYDANRNRLSSAQYFLRKANPTTDITIIVSEDAFFPSPSYYLTELVRRGNLITASEILGLQVLQKEGGIYLATNVLPEIDEKLFNVGHRSLIQTSIQDPQGVESKAVIASCILDALMEKTDPETGTGKILAREKLIKDYPVYNIDSARRTKIETIIQRAIEKKIPLFKSLGVVKVDPFFRCCYADGYAKAVAVKKFDDQEGIPFITHLLSNFAKTYAIIEKYNPLTLKLTEPALRQSLISEIEAEIKRANLQLSAKAVLSYRWDILNQYEQTSPELLGTPAYNVAYAQLLDNMLDPVLNEKGQPIRPTNALIFQKKFTPSFNAITPLTEEVSRSHLMGPMYYLEPFSNSPQYGGQYIIQIHNDEISTKTARFLYHQNRDISDWYRYDEAKNTLSLQPDTLARVNKGRYIVWAGNGQPIPLLHALKITASLKAMLPINITRIEQLTLVACQPESNLIAGNNHRFIKSLYDAFDKSDRKISIDRIVVQEKLFTVDSMGRQWQGKLPVASADNSAVAEITWENVIESDKVGIATRSTNMTLSYTTRPLVEDRVMRNKIIAMATFNPTPFALGSVMEIPLIPPEKLEEWMKDPHKLDGWIDQATAKGMLDSIKQGVVVTVAESMALIAAMGAVDHELIISDPDLTKISVVMQALRLSLEVETYTQWYELLDFSCGKIEFNLLVNTLFPTQTARDHAFGCLQWRVSSKRITFFNLNLNKDGSATSIRQGMKSKAAIKAIFLGSLEGLLLPDSQVGTRDNLIKQARHRVDSLEINLNSLQNTAQPPHAPLKRYYYSLWEPKPSLQQRDSPLALENYINSNDILRAMQLHWRAGNHPSFDYAVLYSQHQAWKRINHNVLNESRLAPGEWVILFSTLRYDPIDQLYTISYLNISDHNITDITTREPFFAEMRMYLDKKIALIKHHHPLMKKKSQIARAVGRTGGTGGFANFDDSILSIYHFFSQAVSVTHEKKEPLSFAIKLHTWISLLGDINNISSMASTLTDGSERLLESAVQNDWLFKRFTGTINALWNASYRIASSPAIKKIGNATTTTSFALTAISFVFNSYEYYQAKNDLQRSHAIVRMAFDGVNFAFTVGSLWSLGFSPTLAPFLIVIGAGYGLSKLSEEVSYLLGENTDNITKAQLCGIKFNQIKQGFEQGGFTVVNDKVLVPVEGAVMKRIHLENTRRPYVIFDDIGVQMRKKTAQGKDLTINKADPYDPVHYINLRALSGIEENQAITIADLPIGDQPAVNTVILPKTPRTKIDPKYKAVVAFMNQRGDIEFDAMRFFAEKDPHFIYLFHRSLNIPNPLSILSKLEQKVGFDWMLINDLQYHYEKTDINIYFGNNNYNVMLQGIKEDQKITDSVSKNYLHYRFYGSEQGSATIFLVFNRGQADITIARSNPNIVWIINANHPYIPEMSFEVTNEGYKLFDVNADEYGDKNSIAIKVIDRANTNITFQLPLGIISIKCDEKNSCKRIVREFNADQFIYYLTEQTIQILDPKKETKRMSPARKKLELTRRYLRLMIQNTHFSPNYIPVKKLSLIGDEKSDQVYYSTHDEQFVHTANKPGTLFEDTNRTDVHVLFFGEKYAWFKGDLLMQVASEGLEHLYYYRNLFWLSEIKTHRLQHIYLPLCHLPDVLDTQNPLTREKIALPSQSTLTLITQPKDITRYIVFEQRYQAIDHQQPLIMRYKIDTQYPQKGLIFTEAQYLPEGIQQQLIQSGNLSILNDFMKNKANTEIKTLDVSKLDPWTGTGSNVVAVDNMTADTVITIGRKLLWPLHGSIVLKGEINARLPDEVINNPDNLIHYAGTTKIVIDEDTAVEVKIGTSTKYYHFWCVTDQDQKFKKLYVQQDQLPATEMQLGDFNITNNQILSIKNKIIRTVDGKLYGLNDNETLLLVGIGQDWLVQHESWWFYFKRHIDQLTERMEGTTSLPTTQKKSINIAPYLTLSGLLQNDGIKPLSAWYDRASKQFIFWQNEEDQQLVYLGMDSQSKVGAWVMTISNKNQKEIGYIDAIEIDEVGKIFHGIILKKKTKIPSINTVTSATIADKSLSFTQASPEKEGIVKGTTTDGLLLDISRENGAFHITLLAVDTTLAWKQEKEANLSRSIIEIQLGQLVEKYHAPEVIKVTLSNNQQGWYHAGQKKLFLPFTTDESGSIKTHNLDQYLGLTHQSHSAYFNSKVGEQLDLIKMNQDGTLEKKMPNKGMIYQRAKPILILDSGPVSVLADDDYINIDVPALLITTPFTQTQDQSFTFSIDKFSYPMIYLMHLNLGKLRCIMPTGSTPESLLITQKGWNVCVIIKKNLVMLLCHKKEKLEFIFNGIEMPAKGLSTHYTALNHELQAGSLIDVSISFAKLETYYHAQYPNENKYSMDGHLVAPFPAF